MNDLDDSLVYAVDIRVASNGVLTANTRKTAGNRSVDSGIVQRFATALDNTLSIPLAVLYAHHGENAKQPTTATKRKTSQRDD